MPVPRLEQEPVTIGKSGNGGVSRKSTSKRYGHLSEIKESEDPA
jgi:hypothetical protein